MSSENNQKRLFLGCFVALVATAFGFAVRNSPQVIDSWQQSFDLTEEQIGTLIGVGLFPFAISIILLSLVVDRIGYGRILVFAFVGHLASVILTIMAKDFRTLYVATFIYALANGAVEAVINPVVATIHRENKTHWLNILHAGWPGGLVLGGVLSILVLTVGNKLGATLPGELWQWQLGILLLPILLYGFLLRGMEFPQQERVEAGVSYRTMLEEFGAGSAYIVSFLIVMGVSQLITVFGYAPVSPKMALLWAVPPTLIFAAFIRSFGRPMFVFLMLIMFLLATTELGTDGWIQNIMGTVLNDPIKGTLFLIYTSAIMFVLRFFAGPIVHRISPLGLLASCSALAAIGLYWLGNAGTAAGMLFAAATLYGVGKTFFWPTTLGVVSEQYPKGGALLINAISGIGMISIGTLGGPAIGTLQDQTVNSAVMLAMPEVHSEIAKDQQGLFFEYQAIDGAKVSTLPEETQKKIIALEGQTKQKALAKIAILPMIMCGCYLVLVLYFKSRGGYRAEVLTGHAAIDEKFTGGIQGPGEA
ncbi:MFS transporter [Bythopirellula polymerisocia]|uniref:Major Facilitator Superfamily protein n=1 Tax=Bythopirellula polymerisocia TaxID=2528003 RepID=A0A5C6CM71_9BACT|nr:MFS transporter [Bythopirellula polymerisocia]TWU26023.1 Major Facilitator Superfamily protein [Bythopirellula polymerisocia]